MNFPREKFPYSSPVSDSFVKIERVSSVSFLFCISVWHSLGIFKVNNEIFKAKKKTAKERKTFC